MNRSAPLILLAAVATAFVWPDALAAQAFAPPSHRP